MNPELIEQIAERSAANIKALIIEKADAIQEAAAAAAEEAQDAGKDSVTITLSHSIKLDLGKGTQTDKLGVNVKHTGEIVGRLDDPSQPQLELE